MLQKEKSVGRTDVLVQAALTRKRIIVEDMVEVGADVNGEDRAGETALTAAIISCDTEIVRILLDEGADPSQISAKTNVPPLIFALEQGNNDIVRLLLDAGADATVTAPSGDTALCIAARLMNHEIVHDLSKASAKIDKPGKDKMPPIHIASRSGDMRTVQELAGHGADLNLLDGDMKAPLYYAKQSGNKDIEMYLLKHGGSFIQNKWLPSPTTSEPKLVRSAQIPRKANSDVGPKAPKGPMKSPVKASKTQLTMR